MRRRKSDVSSSQQKLTPEQALDFLEGMRQLQSGIDEKTQPISIRVPGNLLRAYKTLAQTEGRSYQTMMIQALRDFLLKS